MYKKEKFREGASINLIARIEIRLRRWKIKMLNDVVRKISNLINEEEFWSKSDQQMYLIFPELLKVDWEDSSYHRKLQEAQFQHASQ